MAKLRLKFGTRFSLHEPSHVFDVEPRQFRKFAPCVDARFGARKIFWIVVARSRVLTCPASNAAVHMPRARMGVRGSGPNQSRVLEALRCKLVFRL